MESGHLITLGQLYMENPSHAIKEYQSLFETHLEALKKTKGPDFLSFY